ncbi:hypothetical protein BDR26DRAFT_851261 [Obelidium mucronatum]|nr:hypothetical protein BDR26DRAFT_851261 [Obelidium mucronatum]
MSRKKLDREQWKRPVPCASCKLARKRCDVTKPECSRCKRIGRTCDYEYATPRKSIDMKRSDYPSVKHQHGSHTNMTPTTNLESPTYHQDASCLSSLSLQNLYSSVVLQSWRHTPEPKLSIYDGFGAVSSPEFSTASEESFFSEFIHLDNSESTDLRSRALEAILNWFDGCLSANLERIDM